MVKLDTQIWRRCHQRTKHWPRFNAVKNFVSGSSQNVPRDLSFQTFDQSDEAKKLVGWAGKFNFANCIRLKLKLKVCPAYALRVYCNLFHMRCVDVGGSQCVSRPHWCLFKSAGLLLVSCHIADNHVTDVEWTTYYWTAHGIWSLVSTTWPRQISFPVFRNFENLKMTVLASASLVGSMCCRHIL